MISPELIPFIEETLSDALSKSIRISDISPVGGGSINHTFRLSASTGSFFLKLNETDAFPGLFQKEKLGLASLRPFANVPTVFVEEESGEAQVLVMEWISPGNRTERFWENFGTSLARLHQQSAPLFGLNYNNYMGSLPQVNSWCETWVALFRDLRLEPQAKLAVDNGLLPRRWLSNLERLYLNLPSIFPEEKPSLLHGDLWSGNFICNQQQEVVLIDPAVYYGHRSVDLAMTTLFGQFPSRFYEAYHHHFPFPEKHKKQWEIANLYPLLVHLNLFGTSYLGSVTDTLEAY